MFIYFLFQFCLRYNPIRVPYRGLYVRNPIRIYNGWNIPYVLCHDASIFASLPRAQDYIKLRGNYKSVPT